MSGMSGMLALFLLLASMAPAAAEALTVHEIELDNGMTFLLVPRSGAPLVAAAWSVRVGSGDEVVGKTGVSHLLEHMMFRGSRVIGTRDAVRELELMEVLDQLPAPASRRRLRVEQELRELRVSGEYALIYNRAGALGIDALTHRDFTLYDMQIPPGRLEAWFWMESDRLLGPVFRDLGDEAEIVLREERQRTAGPVGMARLEFDQAFWGEHPYAWSTGGFERDLLALDRNDLRTHFGQHYRGEKLTAVLVGDFDVKRVEALARKYFGRLPGIEVETASALVREPAGSPSEPQEFSQRCACADQVELRFLTVPFGHRDRVVLDVLAGLLNGRVGRLQGALVGRRSVTASAQHAALRQAGTFSLFASGAGAESEGLRSLLEQVVRSLAAEDVDPAELEGVKNQITTEGLRQLRSPSALARRLLVYEALGSWKDVEEWQEAARAVTASDVRRVVNQYLAPGPAGVAVLGRRVVQP